jgi:hypothetical protein
VDDEIWNSECGVVARGLHSSFIPTKVKVVVMSFIVEDFDLRNHQGPLPSPCIGLCTMRPSSGLCDGCLRTIAEIVEWGHASEADKLLIWRELKRRVGQPEQAVGPA